MWYLHDVFSWCYSEKHWLVTSNFAIYETGTRRKSRSLRTLRSSLAWMPLHFDTEWLISWILTRPQRPAPQVVFEYASDWTSYRDTREKPGIYAKIDVAEYFSFDARPDRPRKKKVLLEGK